MADLIERLTKLSRSLEDVRDRKVIEGAITALSQEREAREKAERERDELRLVGTEKELRRERDDARASLAEAKRLLKPFAAFSDHKSSYVELPVRWCEPIARFLSQEPNHER